MEEDEALVLSRNGQLGSEVAGQLCNEVAGKLWDTLACFLHSEMGKGSEDSNKQHGGNDLLNCPNSGCSEYLSICLASGMRATNPFPVVWPRKVLT